MKPTASAAAIIAGAIASAFAPPPLISVSAWAEKNLVVPDGPRAGERIDFELTPYTREIIDQWADSSPVNRLAVKKSAQTGLTLGGIACIGYTVAIEPCRIMVVMPTDASLNDFNREKLQPVIEQTPGLKSRVRDQISRNATGSTAYVKRYPGGSCSLSIATSPADLRSKTVQKLIRDEASEYPLDLDGQGSPHDLAAARLMSFLASGNWKDFAISTPTVKGECRIDQEFEAGDKRYWFMKCPGCGEDFTFQRSGFKFNPTAPYQAHYVTACCGTVVEYAQKNELMRAGRWVATAPDVIERRSYHIDALTAPFMPWDMIAERIIRSENDQVAQKAVDNLIFGIAHEPKIEVTNLGELLSRREDYRRGHIPDGALLLTIAADVQMRGIYIEVLAHGPDRQSWVIEADYLDGATSDVTSGAFLGLTGLYNRQWPDAHGNRWAADEFGVDAGFRSHVVYEWTRRHPGTKALQGRDGWHHAALISARDVDVDYQGSKIRGGAKLRGVGTWPLKSSFYDYLSRAPAADGPKLAYPPGYCHFPTWLDEPYFLQLTSEHIDDSDVRGRPMRRWVQHRPDNHWLDCRVYNLALADPYFASYTADDWAVRAAQRGAQDIAPKSALDRLNDLD
jgi:phage terminase large subunit GpA-like protein